MRVFCCEGAFLFYWVLLFYRKGVRLFRRLTDLLPVCLFSGPRPTPTPAPSRFILNWNYCSGGSITGGQIPGVVLSRPSVLGYFNSSGDWDEVAANLGAVDHDPDNSNACLGLHSGSQATNQIRNPVNAGAVVATDTLPNFWADVSADLVPTVEEIGEVDGQKYIDLRWNGTPTTDPVLALEEADRIPVVQNDVNTHSARISIVGGDMTNITDISLQLHEYDATPTSLATVNGTGFTPDATHTTYHEALTSTNASAVFGRPELRINWDGAGAIDITLRISQEQMESGPIRTAFMESDGTNAETRQAQILTGDITTWPDDAAVVTLTATAPDGVHASGDAVVLQIGDTSTDQLTVSRQTDNDVRVSLNVGGAGADVIDIANWLDGETLTLEIGWALGGALSVSRDGAEPVSAVTGTAFTGSVDATLSIGHDLALANFFDGGHVGSLTMESATGSPLDGLDNLHSAYGLRRLRSEWVGAAIRVREDSGDTEADIGFLANGNIDSAAITAHLAGANGKIVKWYDQSGNGRHLSNSTAAEQPTLDTTGTNGHPTVSFSGTADNHINRAVSGDAIYDNAQHSWFLVSKGAGNAGGNERIFVEASTTDTDPIYGLNMTTAEDLDLRIVNDAGSVTELTSIAVDAMDPVRWTCVSYVDNNGTGEGRLDGGSAVATSYTRSTTTLDIASMGAENSTGSVTLEADVDIAEFVAFETNVSASIARSLETNQMTYWGIP